MISFFLLVLLCAQVAVAQPSLQHFIFFDRERERIHEPAFLQTKQVSGAQLKYTWRELEPTKNQYRLDLICNDLQFLTPNGKKLFIQLQDVSFDSTVFNVPDYILHDPEYHGGADSQYEFTDDDELHSTKSGWVARRWDGVVASRFHALLRRLGKNFDGRIEGINLPETSVTFGEKGRLHPNGFTYEKYRDAVKATMNVLKESFPRSAAIQYANFMPGELLPWNDHQYLKDIYDHARKIGVGVGGPDLLPYKRSQMNHSYGFIRDCANLVPTGVAVQDGNFSFVNPQTGKRVTVEEIHLFAREYLKLRYLFWCTEEPYFTNEVLPYLSSLK